MMNVGISFFQRNQAFRRLFTGHAAALFGMGFAYMVFMQRFQELNSTPGDWAFLAALKAGPYFFPGPLFGALADRLDRRMLILVSDLARMLIYLALVFCQELETFYFLAVASSFFDAAYEPTYRSAVVSLVKNEDLLDANAVEESSRSLSVIVGIALSGFMLAAVPTAQCFWISAGAYLFSAINVVRIQELSLRQASVKLFLWKDQLLGFGRIVKDRTLHFPILIWTALILIISFEAPAFFPLTIEKDWHGALGAGLIYAVVCTGSLMTSYFMMKGFFRQFDRDRIAVLLIIDGFCLLGLAVLPWFALALLLSLVFGLTETLIRTFSVSTIQSSVAPEEVGRVFGAINMIHEPMKILCFVATGYVINRSSAGEVFRAAFFLEILLALGIFLMSRNQKLKGLPAT